MPKATAGLKIDIDSRSVETASRRSDALASSAGRVSGVVSGLGKAFAAAGTAAVAAGAAILAMTTRIADQADEIGKNATAIGLSTDSYQELTLALELSGSSIGEAAGGFRRLAGNALDAQQGVSTAVDAFAELGVRATTATGGVRELDDILADVADQFQAMPDGAEKTARAMELFGRSGARLIPLLNEGSEGIAEMREEAHEMGLVLTNETIVASEALNDDITRLKTISGSFARELASSLIPRLREVAAQVVTLVQHLRGGNTAAIDFVSQGLELMIGAFRITAQAAVRVYQGVLLLHRGLLSLKDAVDFSTWNPLTGFASGVEEANPAIEALDAQLMALDGTFEALGRVGERAAVTVGGLMGGAADQVAAAMRAAGGAGDDLDPVIRSVTASAEESTVAIEGYSVGIYGLDAAFQAATNQGMKLARAMALQVEQAKELRAAEGEGKLAGAEKMAEALDRIKESALSVQDVATSALQGTMSAFQSFSVSAIVDRDADALKNFGKALGGMLVQLGTMAVAYAAVAALSNLFPALAPLVGPATAAPALAAAGAGAIAAGALLGAATKDKPRSTGGGGGAEPARGGPTTQTTIYNVAFDSLTPARARSRAMVEQVSSSVGSAA